MEKKQKKKSLETQSYESVPTPEALSTKEIHVFLEHYGITNDTGEKLDFRDHPFMWDIYEDWSPRMVGLKAAQVTWSTTFNHKAFYAAKNFGMDIIYSLPTDSDVRDFVSGKTNRLIAHNPIYQEWTQDKDSIEQKRIGNNTIYYRGTWVERAAIMIPADLYIADEVDRSKQETVRLFQSRLQHSKFGWEWYFSNPSAPGVGVDQWWQKSDQKHWFIKCPSCGDWDFLKSDLSNIRGTGKNAKFCCLKCGAELDRRKGAWVKKYEDRDISGYWLPLLIAPWVSAEQILEKKREQSDEQFTNFVLGLPYVGKGNVLTQSLLFQNLTNDINPQDSRTIIGVDNGNRITYVMGNKYGLFYNGEANDFSEIEFHMQTRPDAMMIIDPHGNEIATRKLQERFPGRVYRVYSTTPRKNDQLVKWNNAENSVLIDRDRVIQLVVDEFTEKRIPLQGTQADWWDFWLHWSRLYRTVDENNLGIETFHWEKAATPCDFPFATFYWRVMMDRFTEDKVTFNEPNAQSFAFSGIEMKKFDPKYSLGGTL